MKKHWKIMKIIGISLSVIVVVSLVAGVFADGAFLCRKYLEPWEPTYHQQFDDPRQQLIAHALLAANSHNLQSWKIVLDPIDEMSFLLYVETDRLSPTVDPYSRQITISQGTFLEYLKIAGNQLGYLTTIELFPDGEYDAIGSIESMNSKPVARINLTESTSTSDSLYDYMFVPDTFRVEYSDTQLNSSQIADILALAENNFTLLLFQDQITLEHIHDIVYRAAEVEANLTRVYEENKDLLRKNEWQKNNYRYGFSLDGSGSAGLGLHFTQALLTLLPFLNSEKTNRDTFLSQVNLAIENTPIYLMILSSNNSRVSQVQAGMLYSRILLTITKMGFSMHPLSQSLQDYSEMVDIYQEIHNYYAPSGEIIQMLIRMGQSIRGTSPTMRLDVSQIISNN